MPSSQSIVGSLGNIHSITVKDQGLIAGLYDPDKAVRACIVDFPIFSEEPLEIPTGQPCPP